RVAVACGSAGQFLPAAARAGCDLLLTGETSFHTCLEAQALGVHLLLPGHYASERFAVEQLAELLAAEFPALHIWASRHERDPLKWLAD
ncbi:MAG: Nif3-like dinuclear metal center hexameric protein, partial [Pirellulaceae bacterium]|nr:Nif3-like dinuclear metal center hexameric protein [Pirellulaceae bacterium]